MILLQLIKVLPAGSNIRIMDDNKPVLDAMIARSDKSLIFDDIRHSELYTKVYQNFHVELLDVNVSTDGVTFIINVR